jgi:hypothetical protein
MIRQYITKREKIPSKNHAINSNGRVKLTLRCGHIRIVNAAEVPKGDMSRCKDCEEIRENDYCA